MSADLRRALAYLVPYKAQLALILVLSGINTALSLSLPYLTKTLVDSALVERNLQALYVTVFLFASASAGGFALTAIVGLRYTAVSAAVLFEMRLALYRHLQRLSPRFYARTPLGDILARVNSDVSEIQRVASESLLAWVGNGLFLVGSVAAMFWLDLRLAVVGLSLVPVAVWVLSRTRTTLATHIRGMREASAAIGTFLVETLQAVRLVVTANAQDREAARFRAANATFMKALTTMQLWSYLSGSAPGIVLSAGYVLVFIYGGHRVISGALTLGTFIAFMAYYMRVFQPVQALMSLYSNLATVQVSLARVHELLDMAPDVFEPANPVQLTSVRGAIEFDNVSVDLGRGPVLSSVSFAVAPGESVALVGASGIGKSTIADLMVRLIDPGQGTVRLDGLDLKDLALAEVRRHVVLVDQAPILFHATMAQNIRYACPEASGDQLKAAVAGAGLDEVIARFPEGLETIVGERGAALSAGERQRIALARALLLDPAVLVLDEPTAALDPASERQVLAGYEGAMRGRTTVVITHHAALAAAADRVLVLGSTGIVEQGAPQQLRTQDGAFATLFSNPFVGRMS